jgi:hypothetical protein
LSESLKADLLPSAIVFPNKKIFSIPGIDDKAKPHKLFTTI